MILLREPRQILPSQNSAPMAVLFASILVEGFGASRRIPRAAIVKIWWFNRGCVAFVLVGTCAKAHHQNVHGFECRSSGTRICRRSHCSELIRLRSCIALAPAACLEYPDQLNQMAIPYLLPYQPHRPFHGTRHVQRPVND